MSDRERSDTGQFVETVRLEDVAGVFDAVRGPAITSSDVADRLECTTEAARQKLTRLYDRGEVDKRKSGRTTLWWYTGGERITPDERTGATEPRETAESADEEEPATPPADTSDPESDTATAESGEDSPGGLEDVVDRVAADEWEDTPHRLKARKAAARAVLDYAREHGAVSKQEAKEEVYPEYPVEDQDARTWYRKNIRPVLNEAAEYDQSARVYHLLDDVGT